MLVYTSLFCYHKSTKGRELSQMNTAEYLVRKLEELGINDFFGVPGDYNFNILYAIGLAHIYSL